MMPAVSVAALRTRPTPRSPLSSPPPPPGRPARARARGSCWCSAASALAALSLLRPVGADLRPVGVDHLGPRDRAPRPRHGQRPVVEAAAGALHDAVLASPATTRRPACGWSSRAPAACSRSRWRTGSARGSAGRPPGVIAARRAAARRRATSATSCAATPRACSSRSACGRSSATSTAAAATPSCSASPPRCCGRRCGRSSASTGSGWRWIERRGRARCSSARGFAACGVLWFVPEYLGLGRLAARRRTARTSRTPTRRRSPTSPFLEVFKRSALDPLAAGLLGGADRARAPDPRRAEWDIALLARRRSRRC